MQKEGRYKLKKVIPQILSFICISVLFFGCGKIQTYDKSLNFSFDKNGNYIGFSDLPSNYTIEKAKNDGYFVTQNLDSAANENVWENFVQSSLRKENTSIRIVKFYSGETNSPYFLDLFYKDEYYYIFDSSAENQQKQPYSYLLTLEGKFGNPLRDSSAVVLTNNNNLTFDKLMKAMVSSNLNDSLSISPFKIVMLK